MIYMVDHVYSDPATEPAWHEWYAGYLRKLVSVPGLHTAQRFRAVGHVPSRYLAMYSIDSADVYASEAYKNIGGGGSQSARFHAAYALWTRNLFDACAHDGAKPAAVRAPAVHGHQRVVVYDRDEAPDPAAPEHAALASRTTWLKAVGLHMTAKFRALIVLDAAEAATAASIAGSRVYAPFTAVIS